MLSVKLFQTIQARVTKPIPAHCSARSEMVMVHPQGQLSSARSEMVHPQGQLSSARSETVHPQGQLSSARSETAHPQGQLAFYQR